MVESKKEDRLEEEDFGESVKKGRKVDYISAMRENPWIVSTIVLGLVLIVVLFLGRGGLTGNIISENDAGQNLVDFINSRGANAEIVSVVKEGSLFKAIVDVDGQQMPIYVTLDGKYAITSPIPLTITESDIPASQPAEIPKTNKPKVELYIMSFCPYGNKGEDTMLPVYNLLKDKVDFVVHYIVSVSGEKVSSLHGQPEVDQNIREVCVSKYYGQDKFWKFMTYVNDNCGSDGSCWEEAANKNGIAVAKIKTCFDKEGLELMKAEAEATNKAGASGSPTMIINGVKSNAVYSYDNSDAYKESICSAFTTLPAECEKALSTSTTTSQGGSCG